MQQQYDLWIGGQWQQASQYETLYNPYNGEALTRIGQGSPTDAERAIEAAHSAFASYSLMSAFQRSEILYRVAEIFGRRREELAAVIALEAAKPLKAARAEIVRTIETYRFAAEAAKSVTGEQIAMDAAEGGQGRIGFTVRLPLGVVTAITPFNFPFNLVAHKVGPALAAGNTIVLKPAEQTPISSLLLADIFTEAGLPPGVLNIVTGKGAELGEVLTSHPLVKKVSFTGSHAVGEIILRRAGLRRTTLELGSNAALIVDKGTDVDAIIDRCVSGAFGYNGQVCISLQRILVHQSLYSRFVERFAAAAFKLVIGSPLEENTDITSLISDKAAERIALWVEEAVTAGASVVTGGQLSRDKEKGNNIYTPTVLTDVPHSAKVWTEEVFGPVAVIQSFGDLPEAIREVNASRYGLMAGVYTPDINSAFMAARQLEAGGVVINDIPTFRVDHMPYGGAKDSGKGTEGVSYAIQEMTQLKLISFNLS
ncbi:aldehyde dehydrogenase family protein [Cohnella abietis]|uniref:Aldehyde dehydrogenase n=1 Tax=Cohnella abietis TaxID=2507935 RepID=A0A3T1CZF7_9BACL|nr:aldehyde dehydrogenase family protein [Cohnella abietis]BBI31247.1 aldehyde dehydrogenase [Cohnella abietis]